MQDFTYRILSHFLKLNIGPFPTIEGLGDTVCTMDVLGSGLEYA